MTTTLANVDRIGADADLFAPEVCVRTQDFGHALDVCTRDMAYRRHEISLDRFALDEDLHVSLDGELLRMTEKAFEDVCTVLSVPPKFARGVTRELFTIIVDRLGRLHQQAAVVVVRDDTVVGVVDPAKWSRARGTTRPHFEPVANFDIISRIKNVWKEPRTTPNIVLTDAGVTVDVVDGTKIVEPRVGDVVHVGMSVSSSETGGPAPSVRGYTMRLACSNGAILPTTFGNLRFSMDWRVRYERRLDAFGTALEQFALDVDDVRKAYYGVVGNDLTDYELWNLHRHVTYVYRHRPRADEVADLAIGVLTSRRRELVAAVRLRQEVGRRNGGESQSPATSGISVWDAFNNVTAAAREEENHTRRVALERLGGGLLKAFGPRMMAPAGRR